MTETRYRVKNMCPYDIGVFLQNGQAPVIKAGSFLLLTADDIMYIESLCIEQKFFASRMLVAYDDKNEEIPLDKIGLWIDPDTTMHNTNEEIENNLKGTVKKIEAWVSQITDPAELYNICAVAKSIDSLPQSKVAILKKYNENFDWD